MFNEDKLEYLVNLTRKIQAHPTIFLGSFIITIILAILGFVADSIAVADFFGVTDSTAVLPSNTEESQQSYGDIILQPIDTGRCYGNYRTPVFDSNIVVENTATSARGTLLPVPSTSPLDIENNALHPSIPQDKMLGIIARTDENDLNWLYVEYRSEYTITQYGFVLLAQTSYTGDINTLPIINVSDC